MKSPYTIKLTKVEREILTGIVKRGKGPAYRIKHAHILLHTYALSLFEKLKSYESSD